MDATDADVVEASVDAQGDAARVVDAVVADPVVGVHAGCAGGGFGSGLVGGGRGGAVLEGAVRAVVVVTVEEGVEQRLELGQVAGLVGLGAQPLLQRLFGTVRPSRRWSSARAWSSSG